MENNSFDYHKIVSIVANYESRVNVNLANLIEDASFLSCQLLPLSILTSTAKEEFNTSHVKRKLLMNHLMQEYREKGKGVTDSERLAMSDPVYKELYEKEYKADASFYKLKLFYESIDKILFSMRQEIAVMREEKESYK